MVGRPGCGGPCAQVIVTVGVLAGIRRVSDCPAHNHSPFTLPHPSSRLQKHPLFPAHPQEASITFWPFDRKTHPGWHPSWMEALCWTPGRQCIRHSAVFKSLSLAELLVLNKVSNFSKSFACNKGIRISPVKGN